MIDNPHKPRIGSYKILTNADGTYQADAGGELGVITLVLDEGSIDDACAWLDRDPSRWWLRARRFPIIGSAGLEVARFNRLPVALHSTPASYLAAAIAHHHRVEAGRYPPQPYLGCAILNWSCELRECFEGVGAVICDLPGLQKHFRRSLRTWEPRLRIAPQGGHHVAR